MRYGAGAGGSGPKSENRGQDLNPKKRNVRREQLIIKMYSATLISFGWLVLVVFSVTTDTRRRALGRGRPLPYAASCNAAPPRRGRNDGSGKSIFVWKAVSHASESTAIELLSSHCRREPPIHWAVMHWACNYRLPLMLYAI